MKRAAREHQPASSSISTSRRFPDVHDPSADQILATHARTSFNFAARFLPAPKRRSATDLYAFFRTLDDLVDESRPGDTRAVRRELDDWRAWFSGPRTNHGPREPLASNLARTIETWQVPCSLFEHMLDGLEADLNPRELETDAELETYCYQVASTVGCAMAHVLGASTPHALRAAEQLGMAMQITNILRDTGEDLDLGRVYIPRETLARFDLTRDDLLAMRHSRDRHVDERFQALMCSEIARTRALYEQGMRGIWLLPPDCRLPIMLAARLYRHLLTIIEHNGYDTLRRRASTTRVHKVREAITCWALVRGLVGDGSPGAPESQQDAPPVVDVSANR
jgi:15-cis-phytoene synthase